MRTHIFGVLITLSLVGSQPAIAAGSQPGSPADRAFRFFADLRIRFPLNLHSSHCGRYP